MITTIPSCRIFRYFPTEMLAKWLDFKLAPPPQSISQGRTEVWDKKRGERKENRKKRIEGGSKSEQDPTGQGQQAACWREKEAGAFHRQAQVKQRLRAAGYRSRVEAASRGRKHWKFQAYKWTAGSGPFLAEGFLYFTFLDKWQMIVAANPASCYPRGAAN